MGNFSFPEKQIRDGFNVTFSLVRKSNQKVHQRVATLWIPGERFKTRAVSFLLKFERYSVLKSLQEFVSAAIRTAMFWTGRNRDFHQTQNQVLRKIEVAVRAWRRKRWFKRESARYFCCGGKEKLVWTDRMFEVSSMPVYMQKIRFFHSLTKLFVFSKIPFCSFKNKFSPKPPIPWNT